LRDAIDQGLAELAERDRVILRRLYLEGKEKEEICAEWGMTDAQFRVVLFRAKERFGRCIRQVRGGPDKIIIPPAQNVYSCVTNVRVMHTR